eukprot:CAMPEP_0113933598 /NCGR_PEP_ID=MMETSP1339-20121228/740_1 /TAXON_ID=94617 /ORGANISM="Fibrocapsa japonica" /LENGTH=678 /DNA_ID=CAMNT_0000934937 /DNA_START=174 /DNA_END=2210 /DNA_ORIENTATION=+ /assembly_acc=CAM_ASM_000762
MKHTIPEPAPDMSENLRMINLAILVGISITVLAMGAVISRRRSEKMKKTEQARQEEEESRKKEEEAKSMYPGGPLSVYFGSQTGTAEEFSRTLVEEGKQNGFNAKLVDLEDVDTSDPKFLQPHLAIFVVATYGEGEPTDNASEFVKWLKGQDGGERRGDELQHLRYCVFGLGNKQYEHFNQMGKHFDKFLGKVGAERVVDLGLGDDDDDLEGDFQSWKEGLWPQLVERFVPKVEGRARVLSLTADGPAIVPFALKELKGVSPRSVRPKEFDESQVNASTRFYFQSHTFKVVQNRELRSKCADGGSTRHIEVELKGSGVGSYQTAENLALLPCNPDTLVEKLARCQGYNLDTVFDLEYEEGQKAIFPTPCTVRTALTRHCDLNNPPRRSLLGHLGAYARSEGEAKKLRHLASKDGADEYKSWVEGEGRNVVELLSEHFRSVKVPLADLISLLPHLQPRYYTIASSSKAHPGRVHLTVSVVQKLRDGGRKFHGVCSNQLKNLVVPSKPWPAVQGLLKPSSFKLPEDPSVPILLIGPGTGIAPMRALLQERQWQTQNGQNAGPNLLYFGCRRSDEDYIYREELEAFILDGTLSSLRVAFSREKKQKVYVQHLLLEDGADLYHRLHEEKAHVYVCGGTQMGHDVGAALVKIVSDHGGMGTKSAEEYVKSLQTSGRMVQELWS